MSRFKVRMAAAIIGVLAILGGVGATATPAMAADSCYGDYCSGRDPATTGVGGTPCAVGARTVASIDINQAGLQIGPVSIGGYKIGELQVRWSDRCGTNWARLNIGQGGNFRHMVVQQDSGYTQVNELLGPLHYYLPAGIYYTNMIYSPNNPVQAYICIPPFWLSTTWV